MDRKAQGLSLNTIIIAIIVLIVLVVLIMIFTGYFSKWTPEVTSCDKSGGTCQFAKDDGSNGCGFDSFGNNVAKLSATCPGEQICCSKGLGSGTATDKDSPNCGKEGNAPCTTGGEPCMPGLEVINNKCSTPCTTSVGCVAKNTCKTTATKGVCLSTNNVCCQELIDILG